MGVRLAEQHEKEIDALVKAGLYVSASEFIRDAVKEKIESITIIEEKDVGFSEAKKEVVAFLKEHGEALPSEIAGKLRIDIDVVFAVLKKLKEEGRGEWL